MKRGVVLRTNIAYGSVGMKKIYLDVCCLCRPFDDQSQVRVHLESEAVLTVLMCIERGIHALVSSDAVAIEVDQNPNISSRQKVREILELTQYHVDVGRDEVARAKVLCSHGFGTYDALHVACAEAASSDVLLTTDDRFIRRAEACATVTMLVCNPLKWIAEANL